MDEAEVLILVAVQVTIATLGLIGAYSARYKRVPPNRAMIVYGRRFGPKGFMILTSGGRFIMPIIESFTFLSLEPFSIDLEIPDVSQRPEASMTHALQVHATGTARLSRDLKDLERAASSLASKTEEQVRTLVHGVLRDRIRQTFIDTPVAPAYPAAIEAIRASTQADLNEFGVRLVSFSMTTRPGDRA